MSARRYQPEPAPSSSEDAPPTRPEAAPAEPGTELAAGYRVLAHLNRGNRLDVYDAWSDERDSRCVLKAIRPDRAHELRAQRALRRESRLLLTSSHPHLVRAYELVPAHDGRMVLVLETLGGETLSHLVARLDEAGRRLPALDVAVLGRQLASALGYLHHKGWLHLDLKPSNIVAEAGRARLIDLSIARRPGRVRAGTGTFEYLSPEQARGDRVTAASDVWGLGAVLFAALTAGPPFEPDEDPDEADEEAGGEAGAEAHEEPDEETGSGSLPSTTRGSSSRSLPAEGYPQLLGPAPSVRRRRRRIPTPLADVVDACLQADPLARPDLAEVASRLEACISLGGASAATRTP